MPDTRAEKVRRFCEEQQASRLHIFTVVTPFNVSQDRLIVIEHGSTAQVIICTGCTPRTALDHGELREIEPAILNGFLTDVEHAEMAWVGDAVPPNIHDGITVTIERTDGTTYERVRIVDPETASPHARLIAAWTEAFPEARHLLR
jgi:hypothetical protein